MRTIDELPPALIAAAEELRRQWLRAMLPESAQVGGFTRVVEVPDFERNLAKAIQHEERQHEHACYNLGTSAQVGAYDRLQAMRHAFAIATGTAVNGLEFNARLNRALTTI